MWPGYRPVACGLHPGIPSPARCALPPSQAARSFSTDPLPIVVQPPLLNGGGGRHHGKVCQAVASAPLLSWTWQRENIPGWV